MPGGAGGGDPSQNPSVNSRADTGGDGATATATTIPARLDSLKWILVGGFVAIFALGFVYLLRRPQVVAAGAKQLLPLPRQFRASRQATLAPANCGRSCQPKLTAKVRGSLDELKDNLFRLELRRQAGTISEDDYIARACSVLKRRCATWCRG